MNAYSGALLPAGTSSNVGESALCHLSQNNILRLVIPVPESYVRYIREGDAVQVKVPSLNRILPGKVARFSQDVKEDTRTMHTEVEVLNPSHVLLPGLYAEATLTLEHKDAALSLPLQAVTQANGKATVFFVDADNTLQERTVATGLQTANDIEITGGLNPGDRAGIRASRRCADQKRGHDESEEWRFHNELRCIESGSSIDASMAQAVECAKSENERNAGCFKQSIFADSCRCAPF